MILGKEVTHGQTRGLFHFAVDGYHFSFIKMEEMVIKEQNYEEAYPNLRPTLKKNCFFLFFTGFINI